MSVQLYHSRLRAIEEGGLVADAGWLVITMLLFPHFGVLINRVTGRGVFKIMLKA